jgi:hypothetical protein
VLGHELSDLQGAHLLRLPRLGVLMLPSPSLTSLSVSGCLGSHVSGFSLSERQSRHESRSFHFWTQIELLCILVFGVGLVLQQMPFFDVLLKKEGLSLS